jgi:hypothetical protein
MPRARAVVFRCVEEKWMNLSRLMVLSLLSSVVLSNPTFADGPPPSFKDDIQPFLTRYCVECHSAKKAKAGVRYDSYEAMMKKSRKKTIVAGKPEQSKLVLTMIGKGKVMPPRKYTKKPTKEEIETVKAWIKSGAKDDSAAAEVATQTEERPGHPRASRAGPALTTRSAP